MPRAARGPTGRRLSSGHERLLFPPERVLTLTVEITNGRWSTLKESFAHAIEHPSERANILDWLHRADPEMEAELRSLLAAHDRATDDFALGGVPSPERIFAAVEHGIGGYRILYPIGRGGMSSVFLAVREDDESERPVALKVLRGFVAGTEAVRRFRREREILTQLSHSGIVQLLDWGDDEKNSWLAVEFVEGEPIDRFCASHGLDVSQRLVLSLQVLDAVQHAHSRQIVHRDLKPANILVTAQGQVKLLDFGIARLLDHEDTAAATRSVHLTPVYASPEQICSQPATVTTDLYSLGVVLYELLTGRLPYVLEEAERFDTVCWAVLQQSPPHPMRDVLTGRALPQCLESVLRTALQKEAGDRYASVEAFAADLRRCLEGTPIAVRPGKRMDRWWNRRQRNEYARAALYTAPLLLAAALGIVLWKERVAVHDLGLAEHRLAEVRAASREWLALPSDSEEASLRQRAVVGETVLRSAPDDAELRRAAALAWGAVGDRLLEKGEATAAVDAFQRMSSLLAGGSGPASMRARAGLVQALAETGRAAEATAAIPQIEAGADVAERSPSTNLTALLSSAMALSSASYAALIDGSPALAAHLAQRGLNEIARAKQDGPADPRQDRVEAWLSERLGEALDRSGDRVGARRALEHSLALRRSLYDTAGRSEVAAYELARSLTRTAFVERAQGRWSLARRYFREAQQLAATAGNGGRATNVP